MKSSPQLLKSSYNFSSWYKIIHLLGEVPVKIGKLTLDCQNKMVINVTTSIEIAFLRFNFVYFTD